MSHQHHHSDLVKAVLGNITEYQMPPTEQVTSFWFGNSEHCYLSGKKKVPIAVGNNWEEQDGTEERVCKTVFHPDHKNFDILQKITLETFLPEVKVKDEYKGRIQICWPSYAIFKFVKSLELLMEEERAITTFNSHTLLIKSQFDVDPTFEQEHEWNLGNRPALLEWSENLSLSKVVFSLPFMFAKDPRLALPLFLHQQKPFSLHGIFRTQLDKILRMKDGEEEIPFNKDFVQGKDFTVPKLFGYYAKLSKDEKTSIIEEIQRGECIREYDDFIVETVEDDEVELTDISPTKNIFWFLQGEKAVENNDFGNFLDAEGNSILQGSKIFLSKNPQPLVAIDEFEMNENLMTHARKRPSIKGIWFHSFGIGKLFSLSSPMTVQLNGLHARLKISFSEEEDKKRKRRGILRDGEEFKLTAVLHTVKRIYYIMAPGDNEVKIVVQDEGGSFIKDLQKQILELPE